MVKMKNFLLILIFSQVVKTQLHYNSPTSIKTLMSDIVEMKKSISELGEKTTRCDEIGSYQPFFHTLLSTLQLSINKLSFLDEKININTKIEIKINELEEKLERSFKQINNKLEENKQNEDLEKILNKLNNVENVENVLNENIKFQNVKIQKLFDGYNKLKVAETLPLLLKVKLNDLNAILNQTPSKLDDISTKINILENSVKQINNKLEENEVFEKVLNKINKVENNTENVINTLEKNDIENVLRENLKFQNVSIEKLIEKCRKTEDTQFILSECFNYTSLNSFKRLSLTSEFYASFHNAAKLCENGWLVIQRRGSFEQQERFNRSWNDYKYGFGDLNKEFWLGNDFLYLLSHQNHLKLRVELETFNEKRSWAEYDSFKIGNEDENYQLKIGDYSGTAGDYLSRHNNKNFSTFDKNNDVSCTRYIKKTGWWFCECNDNNLNGFYYKEQSMRQDGVHWTRWKAVSLRKAKMMVKPKENSSKIRFSF
ncbi:fibrinogen-like protein 1 [Onthophagus taurus]|uniref:fibrinogen-like protein 1 n=1 Tax=Onthophagus taurus TaxID=166361 RepID=UPI0039BE03D0